MMSHFDHLPCVSCWYMDGDKEVNFTDIRAAVTWPTPFTTVELYPDADTIAACIWLIREVNTQTLFIEVLGTSIGDAEMTPLVDAICAHPDRIYKLKLRSVAQKDIDRIMGTLTNLTQIYIGSKWELRHPFPPSLRQLAVGSHMMNAKFITHLERLPRLTGLSFTDGAPLALSPSMTRKLAKVIAGMWQLKAISIILRSSVDIAPLVAAIPASIERIHMHQHSAYSSIEFVRDAAHGFPNLKVMYIGCVGPCDIDDIHRQLQGKVKQRAICELYGTIETDILAMIG